MKIIFKILVIIIIVLLGAYVMGIAEIEIYSLPCVDIIKKTFHSSLLLMSMATMARIVFALFDHKTERFDDFFNSEE